MTSAVRPLVVRALTEADAHLFQSLDDPGLVGRALVGSVYRTVKKGGEYRPEWTWVAPSCCGGRRSAPSTTCCCRPTGASGRRSWPR